MNLSWPQQKNCSDRAIGRFTRLWIFANVNWASVNKHLSDLSLPVTAKQKLPEGGEKKNPFLSPLHIRVECWECSCQYFCTLCSPICAFCVLPFSGCHQHSFLCSIIQFTTQHHQQYTAQTTIQPHQQYNQHFTVHTTAPPTMQATLLPYQQYSSHFIISHNTAATWQFTIQLQSYGHTMQSHNAELLLGGGECRAGQGGKNLPTYW